MRRPSVGRIDAAAAASRSASSACSARDADFGKPLLPFRPHRRVGRRKRPVVEQRLDVQHRPAHQDRHLSAGGDRLDVGGGGVLVARDGRGLGDVEHVELVMRDAAALRDGQFRGADVHSAVELHRVGVDDFRAVHRRAALRRRGPAATCRCRSGPTIASGLTAARHRRSTRRRRAPPVELLGRPRRRLGQTRQHSERHPPHDLPGSRVSAATSPQASASSRAS